MHGKALWRFPSDFARMPCEIYRRVTRFEAHLSNEFSAYLPLSVV
jgi:hypothetical protein